MRAVILAGGRGTRLRPYTTVFPKPLVPIDDMPILEVVLRQLEFCGFTEVTMAVGHLAELLMAYFGSGEKLGLRIEYAREDKPLGTAGPLALIPDLAETFLVMNGDVLTALDYRELVTHHRSRGAIATIAMHERAVNIDLGVIETDEEDRLVRYIEKPSYNLRVSMGVYVFEPALLRYIQPGQRLDFPELVQLLLQNGEKIIGYPYAGYWLDIGRPDDYERAVEEFPRLRGQLLKENDDAVDSSPGRS